MKIFIYREKIDFRCGIDGLIAICKYKLQQDPFSGVVFVFIGRARTSIKLLMYDGQGFWLAQKRLSEGKFKKWDYQAWAHARELQVLIWNGDPAKVNYASDWRPITQGPCIV
jgi:transposase